MSLDFAPGQGIRNQKGSLRGEDGARRLTVLPLVGLLLLGVLLLLSVLNLSVLLLDGLASFSC